MKISKNGLTSQEVEKSREEFGANKLPEKQEPTLWDRVKDVFADLIMSLLLVFALIEGVMSVVKHEMPLEFIFLSLTLIAVTVFSILSEKGQEKAFKELKASIVEPTVTVIRDGKKQVIKQSDLVVGDVCLLNNGEKAYADGLIIDQTDFKISNAEINGESDEVEVGTLDFEGTDEVSISGDVSQHEGFINSGALIVNGKATMVVVRVGAETESGKALISVTELKTVLFQKLDVLTKQISNFGYVGSTLMFLVNLTMMVLLNGGITNYLGTNSTMEIAVDVIASIMSALAILTASLPEGLPFVINLVLSGNVSNMKEHNVLLKNVKKGETAGSLSILFSDKTGTMTKNIMSIVEMTDGSGEVLDLNNFEDSNFKELIDRSIVMSSDSYYDENGNLVGGNGTDRAFSKFVGADIFNEYSNSEIIKTQPFNSKNKYSAVQVGDYTIYKGAGEILINNSKNLVNKHCGMRAITDFERGQLQTVTTGMMDKAERVLAIAISKKPLIDNELPSDLSLLTVVGIRDEIRESTPVAIKELNDAGVQVVMVTGDNIKTANAIAKEVGLLKDGDLSLTDDELNNMTDEEIAEILPQLRVVGRAKPNTKRRLNQIAQNTGFVTGMTGDGRLCPVL